MEEITVLQSIFEAYRAKAQEIHLAHSSFADFLGGRKEAVYHPAHDTFYGSVGAWAQSFAQSNPQQDVLMEALKLLLLYGAECEGEASYWYLCAVQNHAIPLISLLNTEHKAELCELYAATYPRGKRSPAQNDILKLLKGKKIEKKKFPFFL